MSFYKLQAINSFSFTCPHCRSESITYFHDGNEHFLVDGDSILGQGIEEAIGFSWNDNDKWSFGHRTIKKCPQCLNSSWFFEAILIANQGNGEYRHTFNHELGDEKLIKVICEELYICQHFNKKLTHYQDYIHDWAILEFSSKELSPMQQHLFGPFPIDNYYLNLGVEILKEIWPTLVAISEERQKEWELKKGELL